MPSIRSEEHTSELQSHDNLVCRLLLEKKNTSAHHARDKPGCRLLCLRPRVRALLPKKPPRWVESQRAPAVATATRSRFFFFLNERATPEFNPFPNPGPLPI